MARTSGVKLLFVPYQPKGSTQLNGSAEDSKSTDTTTTWQKHASREYHRRNKLKKAAHVSGQRARFHVSPDQHHALRAKISDSTADDDLHEDLDSLQSPTDGVVSDQLDPFGVIIRPGMSRHAVEMFHHCYIHQWRFLNLVFGNAGNIVQTVLTASMVSPATFYSSVFSATAHYAWLQSSNNNESHRHKLLQIQSKGLALSHLKREIANLDGRHVSDELLLAMLTMTAHTNGDRLVAPKRERRVIGPLSRAFDNDYYGSVAFEPTHTVALCLALEARGGLTTINMPGLQEGIVLADVLNAFKHILNPFFPPLVSTEYFMAMLPRYHKDLSTNDDYLPAGFQCLPKTVVTHPIMVTIRHMALMTEAYEDYMAKRTGAPEIGALCSVGTRCTYDMLAHETELHFGSPSPTAGHDDDGIELELESDTLNATLYAIIRYASLVYLNQVLWPTPRTAGIPLKLSGLMIQAMEDLKLADGWARYPELVVWAAVLGAVVGLNETRSWFLDKCLKCLEMLSLPEDSDTDSWQRILRICRKFLWYEGSESPLQQEMEQLRLDFEECRKYEGVATH